MAFSPEKLKEVIESNTTDFRKKGGSYVFTCPKCKKKDKLWIRAYDGKFVCWVCAETDKFRGKCEYALAELFGGSVRGYIEFIYGDTTGTSGDLEVDLVDHFGEEPAEFVMPRKLTGYEWPFTFYSHDQPPFKKGLEYLAKRGITKEIIQKYDIRYSPAENRVIFPFVVDEQLVGWQARICGTHERVDPGGKVYRIPKALTTLQDSIQSHYVMFGDNLTTSNHCVLAEGPIDALKAELCGGNVAALGKGVSFSQLKWISDRVSKLYIALDPDAAPEICRIVQDSTMLGMETWLMVPPMGREDFGDCTYEETFEAFLKATKLMPHTLVINLGDSLVF